jgi:hypothetical protein
MGWCYSKHLRNKVLNSETSQEDTLRKKLSSGASTLSFRNKTSGSIKNFVILFLLKILEVYFGRNPFS